MSSHSVGLLFGHLANQQPGAAGQIEHLEADDIYRQVEAAQELLHALESGGDTDADEHDRDLARPTVGFGVEKLSQPRRQHLGIAELLQVGLKLRAQFVLEPFDRFIGMSETAGLFVRPYTLTVMITPPTHHGRFLMYATPRAGGIHIAAGPDAFAEFFDVSEQEAADALDPGNVDQFLTGEALDARIEQIRKFLMEKLPGDQVNAPLTSR